MDSRRVRRKDLQSSDFPITVRKGRMLVTIPTHEQFKSYRSFLDQIGCGPRHLVEAHGRNAPDETPST